MSEEGVLKELITRIAQQTESYGVRETHISPKSYWGKYELLVFIRDFKDEVAKRQAEREKRPLFRLAWRQTEIRIFFAWFDLWMGAYWSESSRTLYVCLVPCFPIAILPREVQQGKKIPVVDRGAPDKYTSVSREEWKRMQRGDPKQ